MPPDWAETVQNVKRPLDRKNAEKLCKGHVFSSGVAKGGQWKINDTSEGDVKGLGI